ncbi:MAG: sensor histidine kinase [Haloarculaceae archaeon]
MVGRAALDDLLETIPGLPLFLVGVGILAFGLVHYVAGPTTDLAFAETLITVPLAASYCYTGYHLHGESLSVRAHLYLLVTAGSFGLLGVGIAGLFVGVRYVEGAPIGDGAYLVFLVGATTSAMGPPMGYYYLRSESRRERLRRKTDRIGSLNQRLSVSNRVLRHNIRNELTILAGSLPEVQDAGAPAAVSRMEGSIDRLLHLSNHAKALRSVWDSDEVVTVDVAQALDALVADLRADHPAVTVDADLPASAPVRAHPKLELALEEVLTNAVVHNDPASLTVSVRVSRVDRSPRRVRVEVSDTGSGIPDGELMRLGRDQETTLEHSEGLGLWLVYWIVRASGGRLDVENTGDGARVAVELHAASRG